MGVAGELEAEAGLLHRRQARGCVIQQDRRPLAIEMHAVERGFHAQRRGGAVIEDARHLHAVNGDKFVAEDADSGAGDGLNILRGIGKLLVVARGKVDAERRRKLLERRHEPVEMPLVPSKTSPGRKTTSGWKDWTLATRRRQNCTPLMAPRCRSLSSTARRPRQDAGRLGNCTSMRRMRMMRALKRP